MAVAEAQSFSAAARQLRISPSVVTNHIMALERAMGLALFHRTTRRVAITDAGEQFRLRCAAILSEVDKTVSAVTPSDILTGHLRIVAPPSFALTALGHNLAPFLNMHPNLSIDLIVTSATPNMISERLDIAFVMREDAYNKLPHLRIGSSRRAFCAAPQYLRHYGCPTVPADLRTHRCLANMVGGGAEPWTVLSGRGFKQINVEAQLLVDNGEIIRMACLDGAGIGNFYRFHVRKDLESGALIEVLSEFQPDNFFIYAVTPHREIMLPHVERFLEFVRSIVEERAFFAEDEPISQSTF